MSHIDDYLIEVRRGNVDGVSIVHKFGRNEAVPNGSWATVSDSDIGVWQLAAPAVVNIKLGGNVADTAAGAGAREIIVQGIAASGFQIEEAIATAGASASSNSVNTFWRVYRTWVSKTGAYNVANTGDVVLESGGVELIHTHTAEGQSEHAAYTIPVGKTGYLLSFSATVDAGKAADIRMCTLEDITNTAAPFKAQRLKLYFDGVLGHISFIPKSPILKLPPLTDIWADANGGGAATEMSVDFEVLLVDN